MKHCAPLIATLILLSAGAEAHHVWIEQEGEQASLYFGEFGMNLHEISAPGGLLNKLSGSSAKVVSTTTSRDLPLAKGPEAYSASAQLAAGDSIVAEVLGYPFYEQKIAGVAVQTWFRPAARMITDFSARTPVLELDIVPTGVANQLAVYFKGKPLGRTMVKAITPSGWTQELRTSREGIVTIALPWQSWYAIQVSNVDATPGQRGEESYGQISHVMTLTLRLKEGLTPPPAPAPADPYIEKQSDAS